MKEETEAIGCEIPPSSLNDCTGTGDCSTQQDKPPRGALQSLPPTSANCSTRVQHWGISDPNFSCSSGHSVKGEYWECYVGISSVSFLVEMQHLLGKGISVEDGKIQREMVNLIKGLDVSFLLTKENWTEKALAA